MSASLLTGTQVVARGLLWEVVHGEPAGEQHRYRLRCLEGSLRGTELDLLVPFDRLEPRSTALEPRKPARLKQWRLYHQAFLLEQALGLNALTAAQPGRLEIVPYQLVPVMRALAMTRPRLLLADGVGLGKTVQAGIVLAELIARRRAHRVLIVSPAGPLLNQWDLEMRTRFGLRFDVVKDWGTLQEKRRSHVLGTNPFDHMALCLTSVDFAKQEKVLQDLERTTWYVVVVDEAHHCVSLGTAADREDSLRRRLAELLACQSDGLLLLTATPHDGYDPHFASLMELLDPSLVTGRGELRGDAYRRHVVRRLKAHIRHPVTGDPVFKVREVIPRPVLFSAKDAPRFTDFQKALLALVAPRLKSAVRRRRFGEVLAFISLFKRSVSTVRAARNTLETIAARYDALLREGAEEQEVRSQRLRTLRDYRRRLERYGVLSFEEEADQAALEAEDMAAEIFASGADEFLKELGDLGRKTRRGTQSLRQTAELLDGLRELVELAEDAESEDPKLAAVLDELETIRAAEPGANVLVYTEYTDSQDAVVGRLKRAVKRGDLSGEVLALSGPDPEEVRIRVTERFSREDNLILVSTDATAEGLNLHERCHRLIHVELPYNPNRLEQRNGRIDRYGQRETPKVSYLYLAGTFEERLLLRLVAKFERQRARLTFMPNTLGVLAEEGATTTVRLLEGLSEEGALFQTPAVPFRFGEAADEDVASPAYQDLLREVERAMSGFDKAAKNYSWLRDEGLNSSVEQARDAEAARDRGRALGAVELLPFVREALASEPGSENAAREEDGVWILTLPPSWAFGMDRLPGYDAETRTVRLTTDAARTQDADGRALGFLGRAHPLVRCALDRVRNLRFGADGALLDSRVSVIRSDDSEPALLVTFLGVVESGAGREFERVLAVRVTRSGTPEPLADPDAWTTLADPSRQIPGGGIWERHFQAWGMQRIDAAREIAGEAFERIEAEFRAAFESELAAEREDLDKWLRARADELCDVQTVEQLSLLGAETGVAPSWRTEKDPAARLAAFAGDPAAPSPKRREAETALRIHATRSADLERRSRITAMEPAILGFLMIVPDGARR